MRCKAGELAVIVTSGAGNEGRLVQILGPAKDGHGILGYGQDKVLWWVLSCGTAMTSDNGFSSNEFNFPDAWLRPIRPGSLDEEATESRELESA